MANPEPTFSTENLIVEGIRLVGSDGKHLKLQFKSQNSKVKTMEFILEQARTINFSAAIELMLFYSLMKTNGMETKLYNLK